MGMEAPIRAEGPVQHKTSERMTASRIRRRALFDALLIIAASLLATLPVSDSHDSLLIGIAAASIGLLVFVMRRGNDLEALARAGRWREQALQGRGLSIAEWHAGVPLDGWAERRQPDQ